MGGRVRRRQRGVGYLELSSGLQVSEHLDDVLGHGWGSGQVVTGGLESVLIGHPGDGVGDGAFGVGEFTLGHGSGFFGLVSDLLLDSALADGDTVLGFVAERVLLFLGVMVLGLALDEDHFGLLRSSGGNSQEDGDQNHLSMKDMNHCINNEISSCQRWLYVFLIESYICFSTWLMLEKELLY